MMYEPQIAADHFHLHNVHEDIDFHQMHHHPPQLNKVLHDAIPPIVPLSIPHPPNLRHHHHQQQPQPQPQQQQQPPPAQPPPPRHQDSTDNSNARITVSAIPSMTVVDGRVLVGDDHSTSIRSYTPLKNVGDGSFGTVLLCDWHSPLPPSTQLSPMQRGAGARPEWAGKRLVAVKRMKKRWEGGWAECKQLKELESLRTIQPHPNVIPLYDSFLLPSTKELYFIFECMEGNLYQLIKSRKGRPLAGGLVASIYRQVVSGLAHIHASGYFHRDMKPENLLVTTTGLADYSPTSPLAPQPPSSGPPEKDVMVIVKLADFGLARETASSPPYTEYVSTRWYRAPEVLLRSRDYSNPVDMWALGTILAELINLRPIFPGQTEVDQVLKITEVLGDPTDAYGLDDRGRIVGGGKWSRGIRMAHAVGFKFPKTLPIPFRPLFDASVPESLVDCIADLLRYDPRLRLTARQCMEHPYWRETEHSQRQLILPTQQTHSSHSRSHSQGRSHRHHAPPSTNASTTSSNKSLRAAVAGIVGANGNGYSRPPVIPNSTPNNNPTHGLVLPSMSPRTLPPSHSLSPTHVKPVFQGQPLNINGASSQTSLPQLSVSTNTQRQQLFAQPQKSPLLFSATTPSASPMFPPTASVPGGSPSPNSLTLPALSIGQLQYQQASHQHYLGGPGGFSEMPTTSRSAGLPDTSRSSGFVIPSTSKSGGAVTSELIDQLRDLDLPPLPPLPAHYQQHFVHAETSDMALDDQLQESAAWNAHTGQVMDGSAVGAEAHYDDTRSVMDMSPTLPPTVMDGVISQSPTKMPPAASSTAALTNSYSDGSLSHPQPNHAPSQNAHHGTKFGLGSFGFGKKHKTWGIFGHGHSANDTQPPAPSNHEIPASVTMPSLKRTQSGSLSKHPEHPVQHVNGAVSGVIPNSMPGAGPAPETMDPKQLKKMQDKARKEAEKAKREAQDALYRERARRVLKNRQQAIMEQEVGKKSDFDWQSASTHYDNGPMTVKPIAGQLVKDKGKGVIRGEIPASNSVTGQPFGDHGSTVGNATRRAANGSGILGSTSSKHLLTVSSPDTDDHVSTFNHNFVPNPHLQHDLLHHRSKARRRDADDDHSMSSADVQSISRLSMSTIDSDPGPARPGRAHRGVGPYGIGRATSVSNLRAPGNGVRGLSPGAAAARSSASLEQSLVAEFGQYGLGGDPKSPNHQKSPSPAPCGGSSLISPPMQMLSLDGTGGTHPISHRKPGSGSSRRVHGPAGTFMLNHPTLPPISSLHSPTFTNASLSPVTSPAYEIYGPPNVNPLFPMSPPNPAAPLQHPPDTSAMSPSHATSLPPFSHLASVAEHSVSPLPPIAHSHQPNG